MKTSTTYQSLTWIDIINPTHDEILDLMTEYHLDHRVAEELLATTPRPKVDFYDRYVYLVLHFPVTADTLNISETPEEREIDFIISKNLLVTVRYTQIEAMVEFSRLIKMSNLLKRDLGNTGGLLFYHLVRLLYKDIEASLLDANTILKRIETKIFLGEEAAMVETISKLNRRLLDHRRSLRFQGMTLDELSHHGKTVLGENFTYYVERLGSTYNELMNILDSAKQILDDLKSTNELLLTTKNNQIMKIITIFAFLLLPISIGIDLIKFIETLPEHPTELIAIGVIVISLVTTLYIIFKKRDWI